MKKIKKGKKLLDYFDDKNGIKDEYIKAGTKIEEMKKKLSQLQEDYNLMKDKITKEFGCAAIDSTPTILKCPFCNLKCPFCNKFKISKCHNCGACYCESFFVVGALCPSCYDRLK
jgi:hypothetical protein